MNRFELFLRHPLTRPRSHGALPMFPPVRTFLLVGLLALVATGCSERPPITTYTVNKPAPLRPLANPHDAGLPMTLPGAAEAPPTGEPTDRTLAVIVPITPQGWFFKLTGPAAAVAAQESAFKDFLKTIKFTAGQPEWTLPAGWQARPGNQFRFATLVIPGEGRPLEVSISGLPNTGEDNAKYVLDNVNRWRGQLRMPPVTAEQLPAESSTVDMNGTQGTLVNLAGHAAPGGMGGPFSSGAPNGN
jgi:hypothetical protein